MNRGGGETYLIDGYNLIRRAFRFLEEEHGLEAARAKLWVRLREFLRARGEGTRLILVYDGALPGGPPASAPVPGLEVIFSVPPRNADQVIIDELRQRAGRGPLTVVSSDLKDIALPARGLGFEHLTSEEFAEVLDEALGPPQATPGLPAAHPAEKPSPEEVSPEEVAEWMRVFSQPKPGPDPRKKGRRPGRDRT